MPSKCNYRITWENKSSLGVNMLLEVETAEAMCLMVAYLMRDDVSRPTWITITPFVPMPQ